MAASKGPHNGAASPEGPFSDLGLDLTGGDRSEAWPKQQKAALEPIEEQCPLFLALSLRDRDTPFPGKQQHGHQGPPRTPSQRRDQLCPWPMVKRWAPTSCVGSDKSCPCSELRVLNSKMKIIIMPAIREEARLGCVYALCKTLMQLQVAFSLIEGHARTAPRGCPHLDPLDPLPTE